MPLRKILLFVVALFISFQATAQTRPVAPVLAAKSWLLLDLSSGQILSEEKADQRLDPASLTKLMTAYLTFSAIRQKTLALNQMLPVSENAWRMGGSKMFVKVDTQVSVEDLIKGMIVQSGNDACIVLAEALAGSEENFAAMMTREARRLGMNNTNFRNSTGMPDPDHYTTARDLSKLATALITEFPEEYKTYYSMKEFRYANITQPNRNRLLWSDPSVDGMKTGHTNAAGYCLVSSAIRDQRRLVSVVLGTNSDAERTRESLKLLNWGFLAFDSVVLYRKDQPVSTLRVWKGNKNEVKASFNRDFIIAVPKGQASKIQAQFISQQPLMAPVQSGQTIGTLKISIEGKPYGEYAVPAADNIAVAGLAGRTIDAVKLWFK
jgi:D-alanyl-D-alanine carboxypeptidase (penicillin-binding protein 5/6)